MNMAAPRTLRNMTKLVNSPRQIFAMQNGRKCNAAILKGLISEFSTSSRTSKLSSSSLQKIMASVGSKSKQKFKFGEMQRCLAAISLISNSQMTCLVGLSSDGDLMEGSEDAEEVCSQGKKHSRK